MVEERRRQETEYRREEEIRGRRQGDRVQETEGE
jgi:hypothetical protein